MLTEKDQEEAVRVESYGSGGKLTLAGLTPEEVEIIQGAIRAGTNWIRVVDGRLASSPAFKPLPDPIRDAEMLPFWRAHEGPQEAQAELKLKRLEKISEFSSPSLLIQHLCPYCYTPQFYKETGLILESYGFQCLRSRRGTDGKYWEVWYLPGLWIAQGKLAERVKAAGSREPDRLEAALELLRRVSFGTLDVCVQRLATVVD